MENTTNGYDVITSKKTESYFFEAKNFKAPSEIMVTVTLGEYRKLVEDVTTAKNRIEAAERRYYAANQKIEELDKAIEKLNKEREQNADVAFCSVEREIK